MDIDGLVRELEEELARVAERKDALSADLQKVERRFSELNIVLQELGKVAERRAAPPAKPVRRRRRSRVTAKEAIFGALQRSGGGGVRAADLRKSAETLYNRAVSSKATSNALWTLRQEGKVRRTGYDWFLAEEASSSEAPGSGSA